VNATVDLHSSDVPVVMLWLASIDRLRPFWQPAMHLLYYFRVSSLCYWRINVELSWVKCFH